MSEVRVGDGGSHGQKGRTSGQGILGVPQLSQVQIVAAALSRTVGARTQPTCVQPDASSFHATPRVYGWAELLISSIALSANRLPSVL